MSSSTTSTFFIGSTPSTTSVATTLVDDASEGTHTFWLCPHRQYTHCNFEKLVRTVWSGAYKDNYQPLPPCTARDCHAQISHRLCWHDAGAETHFTVGTEIRIVDLMPPGPCPDTSARQHIRMYLDEHRLEEVLHEINFPICTHINLCQKEIAGLVDFQCSHLVNLEPALGKCGCDTTDVNNTLRRHKHTLSARCVKKTARKVWELFPNLRAL